MHIKLRKISDSFCLKLGRKMMRIQTEGNNVLDIIKRFQSNAM